MGDYETRTVEFQPIELVALHRLLNYTEVELRKQDGSERYARAAEMLDKRVTAEMFDDSLLEDIENETEEFLELMDDGTAPTTGIR